MKKINNNNKGYNKLLFIAALVFVFSCSKDYLDVDPNKPIPEQLNADDAEGLVNSIYSAHLQWVDSGTEVWNINSFSWIGVSSITSDNAEKGSIPGDPGRDKDLLDDFTFTPTVLSFSDLFEGHYKGIQRANQALSRIPTFEMDAALQTRLIGEAKFLRAHFYFRLAKMFGGVSLITGRDSSLERATLEDTYKFIEQDLLDAISALPKKADYAPEDLGRATQGAAKALLAKLYMYYASNIDASKWQNVWDLTNEIMISNAYGLMPNYEDVWKDSHENNQESIFEIQGHGQLPTLVGIQGYSQTQAPRGGDDNLGWGFNTPTQDLADSYEAGDTRSDATIIFRGETLFDGRLISESVLNPMYNQKAYSSTAPSIREGEKNIRVLRYAEVLLMNAEAALETGRDAASPLNTVRNRAGLGNAPTVDKAAIWRERRHELAFEHDRFFDLVRQGRAGQVLRAHGKAFVDGKHEYFPIPQVQIDKSEGILIQNSGY